MFAAWSQDSCKEVARAVGFVHPAGRGFSGLILSRRRGSLQSTQNGRISAI